MSNKTEEQRKKVEKQLTSNGKKLGGATGKGFMPGKSGNPNGRPPKDFCISDHLAAIGKEEDPITKRNKYHDLAEVIWARARSGDIQFVNIVLDRTEGKAIDRIMTKEVKDELIIE